LPDASLSGPDGRSLSTASLAGNARAVVLVFYSAGCHCLKLHEDRLRDLYATYHPRGVEFLMVDSERGASPEQDDAEARRRGYPFPIWVDGQARLARALGAEYASYSVVVDGRGLVAYSGGIDTDEMHLHADATPYLASALDDVLAGRPVRIPRGKALGCALELY
jgi:peroxiredoxin